MTRLKLVHFSDPHLTPSPQVMARGVTFDKRVVGWLNHTLRRRPHFARGAERFAAMTRFQKETGADVVLCSGDLTVLGTPLEFAHAEAHFRELAAQAPRLLTIPGNHDLYVDGPGTQAFGRYFGRWLPGGEASVRPEGMQWPQHTALNDTWDLLAVNSAVPHTSPFDSTGFIPQDALASLATLLRASADAGRNAVVVTHYAPLLADSQPDRPGHGLRNYAGLLEVLQTHPRAILLHGHVHRRFSMVSKPWGTVHFGAGSLTQDRFAGFWNLDLGEHDVQAIASIWRGDAFHPAENERVSVSFRA